MARYGLCIDGAGIHQYPRPGSAGDRLVYGPVWVVLPLVDGDQLFGAVSLPLRSRLYDRTKYHPNVPPDSQGRYPFWRKVELASEALRKWAKW